MKVKLMNFSKILIFIILCLILILYNLDIFTSTMLILIYSILNSINIFNNKMKIDYEKLVLQGATGLYLQRDLLFLDNENFLTVKILSILFIILAFYIIKMNLKNKNLKKYFDILLLISAIKYIYLKFFMFNFIIYSLFYMFSFIVKVYFIDIIIIIFFLRKICNLKIKSNYYIYLFIILCIIIRINVIF